MLLQTEGPEAGYGIIGSLYRAGPVPVFQRIVNPDTYEQAGETLFALIPVRAYQLINNLYLQS